MIARLNLILANVFLAVLAVAVFQRLLGFPPLVLFGVPVAIVFRVLGFVAALTAAVAGAAVGDYFFVAPIGRITVPCGGSPIVAVATRRGGSMCDDAAGFPTQARPTNVKLGPQPELGQRPLY